VAENPLFFWRVLLGPRPVRSGRSRAPEEARWSGLPVALLLCSAWEGGRGGREEGRKWQWRTGSPCLKTGSCPVCFGHFTTRHSSAIVLTVLTVPVPSSSFAAQPARSESLGGPVGIATAYGLSSSPCRVKNFDFPVSSRPAVRPTQPPGPGRGADHCAPSSVEANKTWIYTATPP
jgi:hypothetical protein